MQLSFPSNTMPASCSRAQMVASKSGMKSSITFELPVVGTSFV